MAEFATALAGAYAPADSIAAFERAAEGCPTDVKLQIRVADRCYRVRRDCACGLERAGREANDISAQRASQSLSAAPVALRGGMERERAFDSAIR